MHRNLIALTEKRYDLLIVGGGIYGACLARESSLQGLSVALVEKSDFGGATSANSLKIIHGGLRYLQHADIKRMRESITERRILMQIAPHLVHPLPVLFPTYGHGMKGREAMAIALKLNDWISCDRNRIGDPQKQIPNGKIISSQECLQTIPHLTQENLTGAAIFYDAQVYNSERLTLAFLQGAVQEGAVVANYVEVTEFLRSQQQVTGVTVQDQLTGDRFTIRAQTVVNTCGPWINKVLGLAQQKPLVPFAKAMNFVLSRSLFDHYAVGIDSRNSYNDPDALINKGSRLFFVAPWRDRSMVGTFYGVCNEDPDTWSVTEEDIQTFLTQINQAYPAAQLTREEISFVHQGLLPQSEVNAIGEPVLAKHYQLRDHHQDGWDGLISVVGVKYTTARNVAQKVVETVLKRQEKTSSAPKASTTPLPGGEIPEFDKFLEQAIANKPQGLNAKSIQRLVYNYGSVYGKVLQYLESDSHTVDDIAVIKAETLYGIREEMAQKLSDIIFRRTELGSAGQPEEKLLAICSQVMGSELGWSNVKIEKELQEVRDYFQFSQTSQSSTPPVTLNS